MKQDNTDIDNFKRQNQLNQQALTKRSMVVKEEHPLMIVQPSIDYILALQLSDTLMDTAYHLAAIKISMALHKVCDPLQKLFCGQKSWSFQNIKMYSNRKEAAEFQQAKNKQKIIIQPKQAKQLVSQNNYRVVNLTPQQKTVKICQILAQKLKKMIKILDMKKYNNFMQGFLRISMWNSKVEAQLRKQNKNQIYQVFQRYQTRMRERIKKFQRQSIGKYQTKKSLNTSSFSLDKSQYKSQKLIEAKTPQKIMNKVSTRTGTLSSASKQSPKQPVKYKKSPEKGHLIRKTSPNNIRKSLHREVKSPLRKAQNTQIKESQQNSLSSSIINSQNLQNVSKQKELLYLRKKYYKLVEQFRQFSERFLKVIKQE